MNQTLNLLEIWIIFQYNILLELYFIIFKNFLWRLYISAWTRTWGEVISKFVAISKYWVYRKYMWLFQIILLLRATDHVNVCSQLFGGLHEISSFDACYCFKHHVKQFYYYLRYNSRFYNNCLYGQIATKGW